MKRFTLRPRLPLLARLPLLPDRIGTFGLLLCLPVLSALAQPIVVRWSYGPFGTPGDAAFIVGNYIRVGTEAM